MRWGRRAEPADADHAPTTLVLHDGSAAVEGLGPLADDAILVRLGDEVPAAPRETAVLAVADVTALRRAVTGLPNAGRARRLVVLLATPAPSTLEAGRVGDGWPLVALRSSPDRLEATYAGPVPVRRVLIDVARRAGHAPLTAGWPVVGVEAADWPAWPVADPDALVPPDAGASAPDVVLARDVAAAPALEPDPVTGRAPVVVTRPADPSWVDVGELERAGDPLWLGPLDDQVLNPTGFRRQVTADVLDLDPAWDLGSGLPAGLREVGGVRVGWTGGSGPLALARTVAGLALAGVPLVSVGAVPGWASRVLGPDLVAALDGALDGVSPDGAGPPDRQALDGLLTDPLAREERSVRQRRAAHRDHAAPGWRRRLGERAGLPRALPRVSVLLCTRRPEMVGFALHQVARQQGVELEVVLACHGFDAPATPAGFPFAVTPVSVPADVVFGEALNLAARHATGDLLLKMDDDDWYGPDFVADLLLARGWSGADLVGTPQEFFFLMPEDVTVRHRWPVETYVDYVAGGTMLVERGTFLDVGGFRPVRRHVDAALLLAVRNAGGSTYRTHGLGYLGRRTPGGHTWQWDNADILSDERVVETRPGFWSTSTLAATRG